MKLQLMASFLSKSCEEGEADSSDSFCGDPGEVRPSPCSRAAGV